MDSGTWIDLLDLAGYRTARGATSAEFEHAEDALVISLPESLRALYAHSDGVYSETGEWWVIWPLKQLVENNASVGQAAWSRLGLIAFGDNGAGERFCVSASDPLDVHCWDAIDGDAHLLAPDVRTFWLGWVAGTITT